MSLSVSRLLHSVAVQIVTACMLVVFISLSANAQVARLHFEGNALDEMGNPTTPSGDIAYIGSNAIEGSQCIDFNNTGRKVELGGITLGNTFTLSGWYKVWVETTNQRCLISNGGASAPINGFELYLDNNKLIFRTGDGINYETIETVSEIHTNGVWQHFALTVDITNDQCKMYIDGAEKQVTGSLIEGFSTGAPLNIGGDAAFTMELWGCLDDVQIYDCALKPEEILKLISTLPDNNSRGKGDCIIDVESVAISWASSSMRVGDTRTLVAVIAPADADNKNVSWKSSNPNIVSVDSVGRIVAEGIGTATIKVTTEDQEETAERTFTVSPALKNVAINGTATQSSTRLMDYASKAIDDNTDGIHANGSVAHTLVEADPWLLVDLGTSHDIKAVEVWDRTDACCKDRLQNFQVQVSANNITPVITDPFVLRDTDGMWFTVSFSQPPDPMKSFSVNYPGRYVRIVQLESDIQLHLAEVRVLIEDIVGAEAVTLSSTAFTLTNENPEYTLTATVTPSNATNKNVTWTTSDASVVTVNEGGDLVAVAEGTAKVKATTKDGGYVSRCTVTVDFPNIPPEVVIDQYSPDGPLELVSGTTSTVLTVSATDADNDPLTYTWEEITSHGATINNAPAVPNGVIGGLEDGKLYEFQVTVDDGEDAVSKQIDVVVLANTLPVVAIDQGSSLVLPVGTSSTALSATASDADGQTLSYSWTATPMHTGMISNGAVPGRIDVLGLTDGQSYTIEVTVSDGIDAVTQSIEVSVEAPIMGEAGWVNDGDVYLLGKNTGVGTDNPQAALHINDEDFAALLISRNEAGYSNHSARLGMASGAANTGLLFQTTTNTGSSWNEALYIQTDGKVGINTRNPDKELTVNGGLKAKRVEIIADVQANGSLQTKGASTDTLHVDQMRIYHDVPTSDYVFEEDYPLMELSELQTFVKQNKHLPEVPSAKEFSEEGYSMGEMDDLLLRKIEELTLYILEQQRKINKLMSESESIE